MGEIETHTQRQGLIAPSDNQLEHFILYQDTIGGSVGTCDAEAGTGPHV